LFLLPGALQVVCDRRGDQRILGLHILCPGAGEILQGFSAAMRLGLTYPDLRATIGIHPTIAEEIVKVQITKRSGEACDAGSC
jgi:pyruvate/2-oxoglutarate dehydrogenase complex dihydrolipoamide dehydrogenase (E3) component